VSDRSTAEFPTQHRRGTRVREDRCHTEFPLSAEALPFEGSGACWGLRGESEGYERERGEERRQRLCEWSQEVTPSLRLALPVRRSVPAPAKLSPFYAYHAREPLLVWNGTGGAGCKVTVQYSRVET